MYDHDYDAVGNFEEAFTCATCKKGYKHYRSLRQHVKQVHPNEQIELAPPLKNAKTYEYKCEQCPRQFSDVYNLRSHKRKVHGNQSYDLVSKEGIHKCVMCNKGYIHYRTLRQHVKKVHPDQQFELAPPLKDAKTYQYKCELCPRQFSDVYNLRSHKRKVHGNQCDDLAPKHEVLHKCVMCSHKATKREILIHFEEVHDVKLDIIKVEFDTYDHFIQWKEEFEKETKSKFVKERGDLITKCNTKQSFVCHRSGHYVSKGTGERHLKMQGSNKIDGFCPAKIDVTLVNSKCSIEVTTSHVGHADEIDHPFLTASEHNSIAAASTGPSSLDERKASIKRKFIDAIDKLLINEQVDVLENMHTTLGPTLEAVYNSVSKSPEFTNAHTSISHEDIQPQRKLFSPKKAKRKPKTVIAKPTEVESHEIALPLIANDGNINDPLHMEFPLLKKPLHFHGPNETPPDWLVKYNEQIVNADAFIVISGEYNRCIPPALTNMMDHFPPASYKYRPCSIVCYSGGPGGGSTAGMQLRYFLGELSMVTPGFMFTNAVVHEAFSEEGIPSPSNTTAISKANRLVSELEWYGAALKVQRGKGLPSI